jgi:hypothetical protein
MEAAVGLGWEVKAQARTVAPEVIDAEIPSLLR